MANITVNKENFKIDERELEQGSLSIGRNKDNALHIDDPAVSNHHAQIVTVFESSYVEDLGSTNGTFVNGKKIKTHTLHNGDVLTVGHYQILFQKEHINTSSDANATMMMGVSQLKELTKKAHREKAALAQKKHAAAQASHPSTNKPAVAQNAASETRKPDLHVHENDGVLIPDETELPDIDENAKLLDRTQNISPNAPLYNRRKSDQSALPSLKVIALAVLATVATFTLLMLVFK
jgi:pSer/pThr/pTyr-binding forkhead associated (FHA) protein